LNGARRLLDIVVGSFALVLLSPFLALISLLVRSTSGAPVLYRGQRVGKDGRVFDLLKFRTMVTDKTGAAPRITRSGDIRVTPVGRWLRRWKLDELPQLVNVVIGEMSLVGPRPEDPRYVAHYNEEQREVLSVAPGLTSPASVLYVQEESLLAGPDWEQTYVTSILPEKLRLELDYLRRRTLGSDIGVLLATARSIVLGGGKGKRKRKRANGGPDSGSEADVKD
jgi:lipopolysaccharide/colanic/teichoic acid biosynthesis glycosyltransferase